MFTNTKMRVLLLSLLLQSFLFSSGIETKNSNTLDADKTAAVMAIITNFILSDDSSSRDMSPPTIELMGVKEITLQQGATFSDPGVNASDNIDANITVTVSGHVDTSTAGEYTLVYTATDKAGNSTTTTRIVTVKHDNLALLYGKATEGSNYYGRYSVSNVLDDKNDTFNHTDTTNNWLQVELPEGLEIREIVIINRSTSMDRLNEAKVYLNNQSYNGTFNEDNLVGTLTSDLEQKINFETPKTGNFVLIKAKGNNYLHVAEVKVYGDFGEKPYIVDKNVTFSLDFNETVGAFVGKIDAKVKDAKSLEYHIVGDTPFSIDSNGVISLNEKLNYNVMPSYDFKVRVSNDNFTSEADVKIKLLSSHGVKAWRWSNIGGKSINDFMNSEHYKNDPADKSFYLEKFDINEDKNNEFGQKMSALLRVPKSGFYTFAIIGNNGTRLDFNGTPNFAHKTYWGYYQDWNSAGKSKKVYLKKGEIYPITAYLKEDQGGENLSVGWKMPESENFTLIPADYLYQEELNSTNIKPEFISTIGEFTLLKSENSIGDTALTLEAYDSQDELTYSVVGDVPFTIDENGNIIVNDLSTLFGTKNQAGSLN